MCIINTVQNKYKLIIDNYRLTRDEEQYKFFFIKINIMTMCNVTFCVILKYFEDITSHKICRRRLS